MGPEKRGTELAQQARLGRGAAHIRSRGWITGPFTPRWRVWAVSTRKGAQRVCPPCGEPGPSASLSGPRPGPHLRQPDTRAPKGPAFPAASTQRWSMHHEGGGRPPSQLSGHFPVSL